MLCSFFSVAIGDRDNFILLSQAMARGDMTKTINQKKKKNLVSETVVSNILA